MKFGMNVDFTIIKMIERERCTILDTIIEAAKSMTIIAVWRSTDNPRMHFPGACTCYLYKTLSFYKYSSLNILAIVYYW